MTTWQAAKKGLSRIPVSQQPERTQILMFILSVLWMKLLGSWALLLMIWQLNYYMYKEIFNNWIDKELERQEKMRERTRSL